MNKDHIQFHLQEAKEAIESLLSDLEGEPDYGYGEYVVDATHIYHHLNTAWNGRDATDSQVDECSEENFKNWRRLPKSDELYLDV